MTQQSDLIAYSIDFTSFLIQKLKDKSKIKSVILFGSISREEAGKNSDVDIFIDLVNEDKHLESEAKKILERFKDSAKYKNYWKLLGVDNEINLKVGRLDDWEELKPSIISNGLILYGKFKTQIKEGRHKTFFIWENIRPNTKRVLFNKQLFGYKQNKKFYLGVLQKYGGERLGKGCILTPLEQALVFSKLFRKYKISVKIKKVLEY